MRVFLYLERLAEHFGPGRQVAVLAGELKRCGHDIIVFVENEVPDDNQYLVELHAAGVQVARPGRIAGFAQRWSWSNEVAIGLLAPVRVLLALADMVWHRRSFGRAWNGVGGRVNRMLPARQIWRPLRSALFARLSLEHRRAPASLVHTFSGKGSIFDWAKRTEVPIVYNENSVPSDQFGADWWSDVKRCAGAVDLTVSVCSQAVPAIREVLGIRGPILTIPCMLPDPPSRVRGRTVGASGGRRIVFGTAARLDGKKGHEVLLQAIVHVRQQAGENTPEFWIAGDGPERPALEALTHELDLDAHVRFLGHRNSAEMGEFWEAIDVFVLASLWEGLPNVVLEAMAHRIPVVATQVGGLADAVVGGVTGILVPVGNAGTLARAIVELASREDLRLSMGQKARDRFQELYRPDHVVQQYVRAYTAVCNGSTP